MITSGRSSRGQYSELVTVFCGFSWFETTELLVCPCGSVENNETEENVEYARCQWRVSTEQTASTEKDNEMQFKEESFCLIKKT